MVGYCSGDLQHLALSRRAMILGAVPGDLSLSPYQTPTPRLSLAVPGSASARVSAPCPTEAGNSSIDHRAIQAKKKTRRPGPQASGLGRLKAESQKAETQKTLTPNRDKCLLDHATVATTFEPVCILGLCGMVECPSLVSRCLVAHDPRQSSPTAGSRTRKR